MKHLYLSDSLQTELLSRIGAGVIRTLEGLEVLSTNWEG